MVYISCVVCELLHSEGFTQCAHSAHQRVLTRKAEAVTRGVAAAIFPEVFKKKNTYNQEMSVETRLYRKQSRLSSQGSKAASTPYFLDPNYEITLVTRYVISVNVS